MDRIGLSMIVLGALCLSPTLLLASESEDAPFPQRLIDGRSRTLDLLDDWKFERLHQDAHGRIDGACSQNPRPTYSDEEVYDDDTYKFRIHYTLSASDPRRVSEQDVLDTADSLRWVIDTQRDVLGYLMPPDDTVDAQGYCNEGFGGNGGNGYYDVYFVDSFSVYGYAQPMSFVTGSSQRATSFLALATWILDVPGALEVTVAHEFFHAVQFNYDVFEDTFWLENTATWMEEIVYDSVNDYYNYLPDVFNSPNSRLSIQDLRMYGYAIWPLFMSENLSPEVIQDIWKECAKSVNPSALASQKAVLDDDYPGGWEQAVLDFRGAMYNWDRFQEGEAYPDVNIARTPSSLPSEDSSIQVANTGAKIIALNADTLGVSDDTINVCFEGSVPKLRARVYARKASNQDPLPVELSPDDNDGCVGIEAFGSTYDEVAIVASYLATNEGTASFAYSACLSSSASCEEAPVGVPAAEAEVVDEEGSSPAEGGSTGGGGNTGGEETGDTDSEFSQESFNGSESGGTLCVSDEEPEEGETAGLLFLFGHLLAGLALRRRTRLL